MTFSEGLIAGVVGLVSGALGTFIAPWVSWAVEKKRLIRNDRQKAIASWRGNVRALSHPEILRDFPTSSTYHSLLPHLTESTLGGIEAWMISPHEELQDEIIRSLNADIAAVERAWNLL